MASLQDIGVAAAINILTAVAFLVAFAILRLQPVNDRVYFPKWYLKGIRSSPTCSGAFVSKFVNLDFRTYLRFLNWMPAALRMPEPELIDHAGLDSAVYIRIYLLGLKIFVPVAVLAFMVLVPVNWTGESLEHIEDITFSDIDKLSISNVPPGSKRFWAHIVMSYVVSFWTCYVLYNEYKIIATMRLHFLASENRRPDQFTEAAERERVISDPKAIIPAAFVSFKTRWGAAVCAQTQQSSNPTIWLTEWAPEPRDVYIQL
ncbi:hypothetical protein L1049_005397 [Liquidambar formosana]|uniref:CSC1/OSCA1-like N-terminal transmembrane domain-containing protein n=1 Tax=Liquidambar formosana TaxID=63359 RepID=A0AAP0RPV9_LIQFO